MSLAVWEQLQRRRPVRIVMQSAPTAVFTRPSDPATFPVVRELTVELGEWRPHEDVFVLRFTFEKQTATITIDRIYLRYVRSSDLLQLADEAFNAEPA